jgi:predicted transcriptional regulator
MNFREWLEEERKDPEFRQEWEAGEPVFQVIRVIVGIRSRLGWTQAELARRMGTNQASISHAETVGEVTPQFLARWVEMMEDASRLTR